MDEVAIRLVMSRDEVKRIVARRKWGRFCRPREFVLLERLEEGRFEFVVLHQRVLDQIQSFEAICQRFLQCTTGLISVAISTSWRNADLLREEGAEVPTGENALTVGFPDVLFVQRDVGVESRDDSFLHASREFGPSSRIFGWNRLSHLYTSVVHRRRSVTCQTDERKTDRSRFPVLKSARILSRTEPFR